MDEDEERVRDAPFTGEMAEHTSEGILGVNHITKEKIQTRQDEQEREPNVAPFAHTESIPRASSMGMVESL